MIEEVVLAKLTNGGRSKHVGVAKGVRSAWQNETRQTGKNWFNFQLEEDAHFFSLSFPRIQDLNSTFLKQNLKPFISHATHSRDGGTLMAVDLVRLFSDLELAQSSTKLNQATISEVMRIIWCNLFVTQTISEQRKICLQNSQVHLYE
jgi:hypothetical protein